MSQVFTRHSSLFTAEATMSTHTIRFTVNGSPESLTVPSNLTLLQLLRETLALTGTKNGCSAGECGACTVLLNDEPVNACMVLAVEADGAEVMTVEGLTLGATREDMVTKEGAEKLHPLQQAFIDEGAVQCGFCTPGVLMSAYALLQRNPQPDEDAIRAALVGNLCRCTGYTRIVRAVQEAGSKRQGAGSKGQETGGGRQEAGGTGQEAGSKRQEAGGKRQEARTRKERRP
jgi:carbon-monoxide dehydrogenase small subunit